MNYDLAEGIRRSKLFKMTNSIWNKNNFNHTIRIGHLMYLYKESGCSSPKDFEVWYLGNGEERIKRIYQLSKDKQENLLNFNTSRKYLSLEEIDINKLMGRTTKELETLIKDFKLIIIKENIEIDLKTVEEFVYIRLFYETHLGFVRERETINRLKNLFPHFTFKETCANDDIKYSIDVEVLSEDKLICGLQIKSVKYQQHNEGIMKEVKCYNAKKHEKYHKKTNCCIFYVYSRATGFIVNLEELRDILKNV